MESLKKNVERATLILMCVSAFIVPMVGITAVKYTYQTFLVVGSLFCLVAVIHLLIEKTFCQTLKQGIWYFLFFLFMAIVSTVKYAISIVEKQGTSFFAVYQMVIFAACGLIMFAILQNHKKWIPVFFGIVSCTISALVLIFHRHYMLDMGVYRFMAAYSSPNILGIFTIVGFFASLFMIKETPKHWKNLFLLNLAICTTAAVLTASRGTIIAVSFGFAVYALTSLHLIRDNLKQTLIMTATFLLLFGALFSLIMPSYKHDMDLKVIASEINDEFLEKENIQNSNDGHSKGASNKSTANYDSWNNFLQRFNLSNDSNSSFKNNLRLRIWIGYLENLPKYVVFGTDYLFSVRPVVEGRSIDPHNTFIYTVFRFGIFELILMLIMLISIFVKLIKQTMNKYVPVILGLFIATMIQALFIDFLNVAVYYMLLAVFNVFAISAPDIWEGTTDNTLEKSDQIQSRIKIIEYIPELYDGGAETLVKDYALMIDREVFDISIVVTECSKSSANLARVHNKDIPVIPIYPKWNIAVRVFNRLAGRLYVPYRLKKILERENANVLHVHMILLRNVSAISEYLKEKNIRVLYTCHSIPERYFGGEFSYEQDAAKKLIKHNDLQMIALHDEMAAELNEMLGIDNTVVIRNGVDFDSFQGCDISKKQKRIQLGIPEDSFVVGHVGRFAEGKNQAFLVEAFREVAAKKKNSYLLMIGADDSSSIESKLKAYGLDDRYKILHHRTDINELLRAMDVFVFPSVFEGLGIALIEAQVAGVRCVASDTIPDEAFRTEYAIPLPLGNPSQWADVILNSNIKAQPHGNLDDYNMRKELKRLEKLYLGDKKMAF